MFNRPNWMTNVIMPPKLRFVGCVPGHIEFYFQDRKNTSLIVTKLLKKVVT